MSPSSPREIRENGTAPSPCGNRSGSRGEARARRFAPTSNAPRRGDTKMGILRPRYAADYRTLLWLAMATANLVTIWFVPPARPFLVPLACYFALTAGLFAHNHNHCATFKD